VWQGRQQAGQPVCQASLLVRPEGHLVGELPLQVGQRRHRVGKLALLSDEFPSRFDAGGHQPLQPVEQPRQLLLNVGGYPRTPARRRLRQPANGIPYLLQDFGRDRKDAARRRLSLAHRHPPVGATQASPEW
jgi:hypothetical protein